MNEKIGILGGGQLGRMLIQEAINWNLEIHILDPDPNAPCKNIATSFTQGDFNDYDTVYQFGQKVDIITIEIENVNTNALQKLADEGKKVFPQPEIISLMQDKGAQKLFFQKNNIPTAHFTLFDNKAQIIEFYNTQWHTSTKRFQKIRKGGYDGRGVLTISSDESLKQLFDTPSFVEEGIKIQKEISIIVSRNLKGEVAAFPVVEMVFNSELNLVDYLIAPANLDESLAKQAIQNATKIIEGLQMVGILAIEMFVTRDNKLLINEMAPRPHNSGHHTIEANITSQFGQMLRAILNLPLGSTSTRNPAAMVNILGEDGYSGKAKYVGMSEVLSLDGAFVHLYGKATTKSGRKMGHITILESDMTKLIEKVAIVKKTLKVMA